MQKTVTHILFFVFLLAGTAQGPLYAHPAMFHQIEDLEEHLAQHRDHLEGVLAEPNVSFEKVKQECLEILEHAEELRIFINRFKSEKKSEPFLPQLEQVHRRLRASALRQDLSASIRHLREAQALLLQFV